MMVKTADRTKRERRLERAEAKAAARRRLERRKRLGWMLGRSPSRARSRSASSPSSVGAATRGRVRPIERRCGRGTGPFGAARSWGLRPRVLGTGSARGTVSWEAFSNQPTLLAVWAPWCPHCQVELPILDRVMRSPRGRIRHARDGGGGSSRPDTRGVHGRPRPLVPRRRGRRPRNHRPRARGTGFPQLYFVASDGTVRFAASGEVDEATLVDAISRLS